MSLQAILALGIFRFATGVKDVKHYHRKLLSSYYQELGRIPNYGNFNTLINQATPYVIFLLQWICYLNKSKQDGLNFMDSTSLKVCENKRIFDHKVCEGIAERGKSSMGWFFGFKLHVVCDSLGRLVSLLLTPGNTDDRKFVLKLLKGLKGLCIADAGYVSKKL
ncbi:MAG: IS982 family transposase, partial [Candidatus Melainabacteria bacterium]|nr:IS982 family transposase [Candidatus Melainabacteria bacterium]